MQPYMLIQIYKHIVATLLYGTYTNILRVTLQFALGFLLLLKNFEIFPDNIIFCFAWSTFYWQLFLCYYRQVGIPVYAFQ